MSQALAIPRPSALLTRPVVHLLGEAEYLGTFVKTIALEVPAGETLAQILSRVTRRIDSARVHIVTPNGMVYGPIPREHWGNIRPLAGRQVVVQLVPGGGGQQPSKEEQERTWIMLAISIVAMYVGGVVGGAYGPVWGAIAQAAIQVAGTVMVNMLIPVGATPNKLRQLSGAQQRDKESQTLSIQGSQNQAILYGPIPVVYGQHRVYRGPA